MQYLHEYIVVYNKNYAMPIIRPNIQHLLTNGLFCPE